MSSASRIISGLSDYMLRSLRADPATRICVGVIRAKQSGGESIGFALGNGVDRGDLMTFADTLMRNVSESIINGGHPDCDVCREHLKRIETARAALGVQEQPEHAS